MNTIPDDCLVQILARVSLTSVIVTGKLVCRRWHALIVQRVCRAKRSLIILPIGYFRFLPDICYEGQQIPLLLSIRSSSAAATIRRECPDHGAKYQPWRPGPTGHCSTSTSSDMLPTIIISIHSSFGNRFKPNKLANRIVAAFPYIRRLRIMWPCVYELDRLIAAFIRSKWFDCLVRLQIIVYWRNRGMPRYASSGKEVSRIQKETEEGWNRLLGRLASNEPLVRSLVHLTLHDSTQRGVTTEFFVNLPEHFFQHRESRLAELYTSLLIENVQQSLGDILPCLSRFGFIHLHVSLWGHFRIYMNICLEMLEDFAQNLNSTLEHFTYAPPLEWFRRKPVDFISRLTGLTHLHIRTRLPLEQALRLYQLDRLSNLAYLRIANEYERTPPASKFRDYLRKHHGRRSVGFFDWEEKTSKVGKASRANIVRFGAQLRTLHLLNVEHTRPTFGNWAAEMFADLNRLIIDQPLTNCQHCPNLLEMCRTNEDNFWTSIHARMKTLKEIQYCGVINQKTNDV